MAEKFTFNIDGKTIEAEPGQTIMQAADSAGVYIPRLCYLPGIDAHGSCRVCSVKVNGRYQTACTQPAAPNMIVESETDEINEHRRSIVDMLFVSGSHFCMFCQASGNCELQAVAYRLGIPAPSHEQFYPKRDLDGSHPDVFIDRNRCILCARCVNTSKKVDGKNVFGFVSRNIHKKLAVNSPDGLAGTNISRGDKAIDACPVGALLRKRTGYEVPVGKREYDKKPIGSDIERRD